MLVVCMKNGLTQGQSVFREGMIFKLNETMATEAAGFSAIQLEAKQKRIYGQKIFRKPTVEELIVAYKEKTIVIEDMDTAEKSAVLQMAKSEAEKKVRAAEILMKKEEIPLENPAEQKTSEKIGEDIESLEL